MLFEALDTYALVDRIRNEVKAPYVNAYASILANHTSVLLVISLDRPEEWANKIMENSRYIRISIARNGTMEQFSGGIKGKRFRKCKAVSFDDVIERLNKFVDKVK